MSAPPATAVSTAEPPRLPNSTLPDSSVDIAAAAPLMSWIFTSSPFFWKMPASLATHSGIESPERLLLAISMWVAPLAAPEAAGLPEAALAPEPAGAGLLAALVAPLGAGLAVELAWPELLCDGELEAGETMAAALGAAEPPHAAKAALQDRTSTHSIPLRAVVKGKSNIEPTLPWCGWPLSIRRRRARCCGPCCSSAPSRRRSRRCTPRWRSQGCCT